MNDNDFLISLQERITNLQQTCDSNPEAKDKIEKAIDEVEAVLIEYKNFLDH